MLWLKLKHVIKRGPSQSRKLKHFHDIVDYRTLSWWRHQMETFSALLAICAGNSPVPGEFPTQRPVTRSFDVFFDLRLNKRLSKQPWGWWFETLAWSLWRHRNVIWFKMRVAKVHPSTVYRALFALMTLCAVNPLVIGRFSTRKIQ